MSLFLSCPDNQNDSLSDQEDHRPGFSMPSISSSSSFDAQDTDGSSQTSKFAMYNSVSQKLMVMGKKRSWDISQLTVVIVFITEKAYLFKVNTEFYTVLLIVSY